HGAAGAGDRLGGDQGIVDDLAVTAIPDEVDAPRGGSLLLGAPRQIHQDAVRNPAKARFADADDGVAADSHDEHVFEANVLGALDVEKNARRALLRGKKDAGRRPRAADDDVALGVVEDQAHPHSVEAAADAHDAAAVAEGVDGLLDVGELAVAVDAVADGD